MRSLASVCGCAAVLCSVPRFGYAQAPLPLYTDNLVNSFQDWGWGTRNRANTNPVHSGTHSIGLNGTAWNVALSLEHPDFNASVYGNFVFWANGGTNGGQKLQVYAQAGSSNYPAYQLPTALAANTWYQFSVSLSTFGVATATNLNRLTIQLTSNGSTNTFFLDDLQLTAKAAPGVVHVSLNATQAVRSADSRWFGANTAIWDGNFDTPTTISLLREVGNRALRGPGGSLSDEYHWSTDTNLTNTWRWATSFANFLHVATNVGAQTFITVNYGTGSSNEAAAWVAYANDSTTNTQSLGVDQHGVNWQTVGYWASLRAAAQLGTDDGKNFLRISRAAPLGFKYWELGNECYGTWETDYNTNAPYNAHDGWTYATRVAGYAKLMKLVDPTIKVGVVVSPGEDSFSNGYTNHPATNSITSQVHYGWTAVLLTTAKGLGFTPDFAIDHRYPEYTASGSVDCPDSDALLLQTAGAWASDAGDLRQQISAYFGPTGTNIELVCTENNSDAGSQGRQSTSLVNGLYYANSLGQLMLTELNSLVWWDLRNGTDTSGNFDPTLYGWRTNGDLGLVGNLSTRYPAFYAAKLMQHFVQPGETVLSAASDYPLLSAFAARRASGAVSLLVCNNDTVTNFNAQISIAGFTPASAALLHFYGIPQDEATRTNGAASAQDIATNTFSGAAGTFNYTAPPLSLSLFTLAPAAPSLAILAPAQPGGQLALQLQGQPNVRYVVQNSAGLGAWTPVATNTLSVYTLNFTNPVPAGTGQQFWRAVWQP